MRFRISFGKTLSSFVLWPQNQSVDGTGGTGSEPQGPGGVHPTV